MLIKSFFVEILTSTRTSVCYPSLFDMAFNIRLEIVDWFLTLRFVWFHWLHYWLKSFFQLIFNWFQVYCPFWACYRNFSAKIVIWSVFFILPDQIIPAASKDLLVRILILISFFHQMKISWIVFRLASFFSLFCSPIFWFYSKLFCRRWIFFNFSRLYDFGSLDPCCAPSSFKAFVLLMLFFFLNWPFMP